MKQPDPLVLKKLTKKYGAKTAVDEVSFSIKPGEVFGLLGPNGAGKTTIISTIMTLQNASSGSVEVFGVNPEIKPRVAKALIGYVPQELVHHGFFNVEQVLDYHAQYFGIRKKASDISYLLHKLDLYVHRKKMVNQLSGGMKRRLMIAKALIHEPKLLLLDEPSAGVDLELRNSLWEFIHELKNKNISILLTTHYLEEAEQLCDRIGILQHGRLRRVDKVDTLLEQHSSKRISLMLKTPKTSFSHDLLESTDAFNLHFRVPPKMGIQELLAKIAIPYDEVLNLQVQPGTLEDVMENILNSEEK
ncbi:ABC transporter ATP-binding protein [Simkania sp.]|uniref:ABC transporter ATP-binding protein n=1 Tax=Simkania sp. TaxID=34094 RepID=UPI003B529461